MPRIKQYNSLAEKMQAYRIRRAEKMNKTYVPKSYQPGVFGRFYGGYKDDKIERVKCPRCDTGITPPQELSRTTSGTGSAIYSTPQDLTNPGNIEKNPNYEEQVENIRQKGSQQIEREVKIDKKLGRIREWRSSAQEKQSRELFAISKSIISKNYQEVSCSHCGENLISDNFEAREFEGKGESIKGSGRERARRFREKEQELSEDEDD